VEENNISSAVEEIYACLLVRFRNCLDEGGYESAERFIKGILPNLDLILERINDELETSKKNFIRKEKAWDKPDRVDLEDVSNTISDILIKIPHDETSPSAAVDRILSKVGMERSPPTQRPDGSIEKNHIPVHNRPHSKKVKSSYSPGDIGDIKKVSGSQLEDVNPSSEGIPATTAIAYITDDDGVQVTPEVYYIGPEEKEESEKRAPETRESTYGGGSYSAEESSPKPAGSGRYSSESDAAFDFFIPEETGKYTPRKIDIYIRYGSLHMEQRNFDEALKFIAMIKELPDYHEHEYYREEVMDLEDTIERNRYQGVSTGGENAIDEKYSSFDFISQKKENKAWHEEDDF